MHFMTGDSYKSKTEFAINRASQTEQIRQSNNLLSEMYLNRKTVLTGSQNYFEKKTWLGLVRPA